MGRLPRTTSFWIAVSLFAVYLINGLVAISANSVVYDETDHWSYGKRILQGQPQKVHTYDDATAMPVTSINAIPRAVEQLFNPGLSKTDGGVSDVMHGRYITLFVCLLIGLYVYKWSKELFGEWGGLFSLFLLVFCPNVNAHVTLLSTDAYTALFALTTFYYFYQFVRKSGWKYFVLFSVSFGIAQVSKYSLLHLLPVLGIVSLIILLSRRSLFSNWKKNLVRLLVFSAIVLAVINVAFFFNGSGHSLESYSFRSATFQSLQAIPVVGRIPLPLPVPYVEGIDITYHMTELGAGNKLAAALNYLNGEYRTGKGFWDYYLLLILYKTPIPYLLILLLLGIVYTRKWKGLKVTSSEFIIGFSLLYFLVFFSFFLPIQSGNRHIVFFYPLLYVLAGRLVTVNRKQKYKLAMFSVAALYSVLTFYYYFPNLISYTNELVADKTNAYRIMADTNLDYGQGGYVLENYLARHRDVKLATAEPQSGKVIIGLNDFVDLYNTGKYGWLKKYKPYSHLYHCYLLFDIPDEK